MASTSVTAWSSSSVILTPSSPGRATAMCRGVRALSCRGNMGKGEGRLPGERHPQGPTPLRTPQHCLVVICGNVTRCSYLLGLQPARSPIFTLDQLSLPSSEKSHCPSCRALGMDGQAAPDPRPCPGLSLLHLRSPWPCAETLVGGPSPSLGSAHSGPTPWRCEHPARSAQQTRGEVEGCLLPTSRTPKAGSQGNSWCPWRKVGRTAAHCTKVLSGLLSVHPKLRIAWNRACREDRGRVRCLSRKWDG